MFPKKPVGYFESEDGYVAIVPKTGESADDAIARVTKRHGIEPSAVTPQKGDVSPKVEPDPGPKPPGGTPVGGGQLPPLPPPTDPIDREKERRAQAKKKADADRKEVDGAFSSLENTWKP